ncbi:receptor-like protein 7 [Vicia villosa]|uniref:receptor-like protein 7 n=1 Tax=Vicia villosa TaxID=3911 RepID=UPI00273B901B|nr:receptor-like protein 7 [Vicia villosa]
MMYFFLHLFLFLLTQFPSFSFSLCSHDDSCALQQFKNSFVVSPSPSQWSPCSSTSSKIKSWINGTDCCEWDGVTCNNISGHVIGLDLSCSNLNGKFSPNSTIFQLKQLQQLNLAFNDFLESSIYRGIGDLVYLTHLNLSYTGFSGNVPSTISHLSKLISLDLSCSLLVDTITLKRLSPNVRFDPFTWKRLIHNATNLRQLYLDGVDMSSINGSFLSQLINVSSSLVSLSLSNTGLNGKFPTNILSLPNLEVLDLSNNLNLSGQLPKSNWSTSLKHLDLSYIAFSGGIPPSMWNLTQLTVLSLEGNNFQGEISSLLSNLTHLTSLDLQYNNFSGKIPNVFENLINLEYVTLSVNNLSGQVPPSLFNLTLVWHIDLSFNKLVGPIPTKIAKHSKLYLIALDNNMLNGTIPHWCYSLPSLHDLYLNKNNLTGPIGEFSSYSLRNLFLSDNNLQGDFPNSIYKLQNLSDLSLSSTKLSGVVDFHQFSNFTKLSFLDLSHSSFLFINVDSVDSILPNLEILRLSSSNINTFPKFLAQVQNLEELDLSNNKIQGTVPKWFHENLLHTWKEIIQIDLSFNKLQGELPIPPYGIQYFLLSNNNFAGDIALSLCNASSMNVLNLAHNKLTGKIPQCLGTFPFLSILDMQMNNLHGSMPRNFSKGNAFETIKLNGNQLEGPLPQSLIYCTKLEVLDLGDNNIEDKFPNWLATLQELQVLRLRSNSLYGAITCSSFKHPFPNLRIYDVSGNKFSGPLPTSCLKNFQGMINLNDSKIGLQYMGESSYYNDSVVLVVKGLSLELTRILTTFTTIDLSNNMFEGEIPQVIGELNSLKGLNLSNNGITGTIPQSLSNLRNLEWLDLSRNQLTGEIPASLTNLNFLSFLNLSQNLLEGIIPTGNQFNTFGNDSYEGNAMLCGYPLSKSCRNDEEKTPYSTSNDEEESGFGWKAVVIGYGFGSVLGMLVGYSAFFNGKPQWLVRLVEHMFNIRLKKTHNKAGANRRRIR